MKRKPQQKYSKINRLSPITTKANTINYFDPNISSLKIGNAATGEVLIITKNGSVKKKSKKASSSK